MVICLERDADLHMAQLMPLPLTVSCFRLVLPFSYRQLWWQQFLLIFTQIVPDKGSLNVCVRACVRVCVRAYVGLIDSSTVDCLDVKL